MLKNALVAALGAGLMLGLPGTGFAAPGGGRSSGGGGRGVAVVGGGGRGVAVVGGGGRGVYYRNGNYGYGYGAGVGIGLGLGYGLGYGYGYDPGYYGGATYILPGTSNSYYYAPQQQYSTPPVQQYVPQSSPQQPIMPRADQPAAAMFDVQVPADAEVWFEGDKTSQTGSVRSFVSPTVQPGKLFTYDIRARWMGADGKPVDLTRQVQFHAGQRITLDFARP